MPGDQGLVPLINVVFLLLTFFMIAGQIQRSHVDVVPPTSVSDTVPVVDRVDLVVDATGTIYQGATSIPLHTLRSALRRSADNGTVVLPHDTTGAGPTDDQADDQADGRVARDLRVLIRADADLDVVKLESVLAELNRAGIQRTALATTLDSPR